MLDIPTATIDPTDRDRVAFHLSPTWFDCWRAAYMPKDTSALAIDGLPMMSQRATLGPLRFARLHSQTNLQTPAFDMADPGLLDRATRRSGGRIAGHDVMVLDFIPENAAILTAAGHWPPQRRRISPRARVCVADCRSHYADWLARRSSRNRQRWRAPDRWLADKLGMQLTFTDGDDALSSLLVEMFALEQAGWKGRGHTAIIDNARDLSFYTDLAHRAAAAGALRLAILRKGGHLVAFEFGILSGNRLYVLKIAYDEHYAAFSVGQLLAAAHIQRCCADPAIDWYDELGNGMTPPDHKLRRADIVETLYRVTCYGDTWRAWLVHRRDEARARLKQLRDRWRGRTRRAT